MPVCNTDTAGIVDLICRKGDSFYAQATFLQGGLPMDFSNSTFHMQVRLKGVLVLDFTMADGNILVAGNTVIMKMPYAVMRTVRGGTYDYDLEETNTLTDTVNTRLAGNFISNNDVTLPDTP